MGCFTSRKNATENDESHPPSAPPNDPIAEPNQPPVDNQIPNQQQHNQSRPVAFTLDQLVSATNNFDAANVVGEGGYGKVYKGILQENRQIVAIKRLDPQKGQGTEQFVVEVTTLNLANHPNLVKMIGHCIEGEERLLVYEFMPLGSLSRHLFAALPCGRPGSVRLDWNARIKIALGAARGLAYLHHEMDPPIVYRDLKSGNVLLDEAFNAKLSDFGFARTGPVEGNTHVTTRVIGTRGYLAPEYADTGHLTFKSDVYSMGAVLLELITGRRAMDNIRPAHERELIPWARPLLLEKKKYRGIVDSELRGEYPRKDLDKVVTIVLTCIQEASSRPSAAEVVAALEYIASRRYDPASRNPWRASSSGSTSNQ